MEIQQIMQVIHFLISIFGFPILGWIAYGQGKRLKTQEEMLKDYKNMFENTKTFLEYANPQNIIENAKALAELEKERITKESEKKIRELHEEMKKESIKHLDTNEKLTREILASLDLSYSLIFHVPPHDRKDAIENTMDGRIKSLLSKNIEHLPYVGQPFINALTKITALPATVKITSPNIDLDAKEPTKKEEPQQ